MTLSKASPAREKSSHSDRGIETSIQTVPWQEKKGICGLAYDKALACVMTRTRAEAEAEKRRVLRAREPHVRKMIAYVPSSREA